LIKEGKGSRKEGVGVGIPKGKGRGSGRKCKIYRKSTFLQKNERKKEENNKRYILILFEGFKCNSYTFRV